ncbi:cold shock domain-containing protein [Mycobacterium syngnathidarum]
MRSTGRVVRFDEIRGYGFIAADEGGEDVFLHANDLEVEKAQLRRNSRVSFEVEEGERGKFATAVRPHTVPAGPASSHASEDGENFTDEFFDGISAEEFNYLVTEALLQVTPALTGEQILRVRERFRVLADKHGWIDPN